VKSTNRLAYESSEIADAVAYESIANEYYDEKLHPTCADFRQASSIYLTRFFGENNPRGRLADIGCGRSLIADFREQGLVLIDASSEMLLQNPSSREKRLADVERDPIGYSEFDWIFAILGDPYNTRATWANIGRALKAGGRCLFIVPSYEWATRFRTRSSEEKPNLACFINARGESIFLPSLIFEQKDQEKMISDAGLTPVETEHVLVGDLAHVKSPKIFKVLSRDQYLLDTYHVKKTQ
jgi:SAM-dependent methyltransferase